MQALGLSGRTSHSWVIGIAAGGIGSGPQRSTVPTSPVAVREPGLQSSLKETDAVLPSIAARWTKLGDGWVTGIDPPFQVRQLGSLMSGPFRPVEGVTPSIGRNAYRP